MISLNWLNRGSRHLVLWLLNRCLSCSLEEYIRYMTTDIYSNDDKAPAIEFCLNHIPSNGYCNTRFALKETAANKTFKGTAHQKAFYSSISSLITKDGKYRVKKTHDDGSSDIEVNPDFKEKSYFEKYPFREKVAIAFLSALLTLCISLIVTKSQQRFQHQIDMQQDQQIRDLRDSINILQKQVRILQPNK